MYYSATKTLTILWGLPKAHTLPRSVKCLHAQRIGRHESKRSSLIAHLASKEQEAKHSHRPYIVNVYIRWLTML